MARTKKSVVVFKKKEEHPLITVEVGVLKENEVVHPGRFVRVSGVTTSGQQAGGKRGPFAQDRYSSKHMRFDIYKYLESEGFEMTEARHEAIKEILVRWSVDSSNVFSAKIGFLTVELEKLKRKDELKT